MIAWPVSARFSRGPLTMGNLPREAKNTQNIGYFSYGLTRRKSLQNLAASPAPRGALLSFDLFVRRAFNGKKGGRKLSARSARFARNICTCFTFLYLLFPFLDNKLFLLVFHLYRRSNQFLSRGVSKPLRSNHAEGS